ncbi:MAG: FAD-binding oxidoreductase [Rudanella sp.]|nr:FAD-binding oxidoreductase [Rudanella sp.]
MRERVLILGAGIQGISCALSLSAKGYAVTLIDKDEEPFSGTSFRNEGKIHLGFVYANDHSFQTSALMLEGAMNFGLLVENWVGRPVNWSSLRSSPFQYAVHQQSMVSEAALLSHYQTLQNAYETYRNAGFHYVGSCPQKLWASPQVVNSPINPSIIQSIIPTEEIAINLKRLRQLLRHALKRRGVQFLGNRVVHSVERSSFGFCVKGSQADGTDWRAEGGLVVNCLWASRLAVDATLGIMPLRPWVYRLKFRMLGQLPPELATMQSYTVALGPFGDIVTYQNDLTYVSWYPSCMRGWSDALQPPAEWEPFCREEQVLTDHPWVQDALGELNELIPGMNQFQIQHLSAGVIFSWGETDIDQPESLLHQRNQIGIEAFDGYFSINTGKLTTAPLFAHQLAQQL